MSTKEVIQSASKEFDIPLRKGNITDDYEFIANSAPLEDGDADSEADGYISRRLDSMDPQAAREAGNLKFKSGEYREAIHIYKCGLKGVLSAVCRGPEALGDSSLSDNDFLLHLNISMSYLRLKRFSKAELSCSKVLQRREQIRDPAVLHKALYRKTLALQGQNKMEEALATVEELLEKDPHNRAAKSLRAEVYRESKRQDEKQKKTMTEVFRKMDEVNARNESQEKEEKARSECSQLKWKEFDHSEKNLLNWKNVNKINLYRSCGFSILEALQVWSDKGVSLLNRYREMKSADEMDLGEEAIRFEEESLTLHFYGCSSTMELNYLACKLNVAELLNRLPPYRTVNLMLFGFTEDGVEVEEGDEPFVGKEVPLSELPQHGAFTVMTFGDKDKLKSGEREESNEPSDVSLPIPTRDNSGQRRQVIISTFKGLAQHSLAKALPLADSSSSSDFLGEVSRGLKNPHFGFLLNPLLAHFLGDWFDLLQWALRRNLPLAVFGMSAPDKSWDEDEIILGHLGFNLACPRRLNPFPMVSAENSDVKKNNHFILVRGGKERRREDLFNIKLKLMADFEIFVPMVSGNDRERKKHRRELEEKWEEEAQRKTERSLS